MERETKMRKEIFESEEEFVRFLEDGTPQGAFNTVSKADFLDAVKRNGFIKKTVVDEAENMYEVYKSIGLLSVADLIEKQNEAIQYLKKQLEEE